VLGSAAAQPPTPGAVPPTACVKPDQPELGVPGNDQNTINAYNARIAAYNRKAAAFSRCSNDTVDTANDEIQKIRQETNDRIKLVATGANKQTAAIDANIRAAAAGDVLETDPQQAVRASECRKPDETLLKPLNRKSDVEHTARYDAQRRAYEPCVRAYIEQAHIEIQTIQVGARAEIARITDDANRRTALLNIRLGDARSMVNQATREGAQTMDKVKALAAAQGNATIEKIYPRARGSADSPKGEGEPNVIACRAPQILPDSRLLGPEICRSNREWAKLYHEGSDISADGLRIVDSERRRTQNATHCAAGNVFC
jgi:hypothetical protein